MTTALAYVRVSTDTQDTERQEAEIRRYCAAAGLELLDIVREDEGVSGRARAIKRSPAAALQYYALLLSGQYDMLERSGYAELLHRTAEQQAEIVVFYALDRFSRDCLELLLLERVLATNSVAIVSITDGGVVDTRSAGGKLMYRIRAAIANHEVDITSERTSATLRNKVQNGEHVGRPPVGWCKHPETGLWEHDPETWAQVEKCIALRAINPGATYRELAAAIGVHHSRIGAYFRAYTWTPPAPRIREVPPAAAAAAEPAADPQQPGLGLAPEPATPATAEGAA